MHVKSFDVSYEGAAGGLATVQSSLDLESLVEFVRSKAESRNQPVQHAGGDGPRMIQMVRPTSVEYDVVLTEKRGSPIVARDRIDARMQATSIRRV